MNGEERWREVKRVSKKKKESSGRNGRKEMD